MSITQVTQQEVDLILRAYQPQELARKYILATKDCAEAEHEVRRLRQEILRREKTGEAEQEDKSGWEFIEEPNTVDTLGRKVYHARCKQCGFVWTDLYAVRTYFKHCPNCGIDTRKKGRRGAKDDRQTEAKRGGLSRDHRKD